MIHSSRGRSCDRQLLLPCTRSFEHHVGEREQLRWNFTAPRLCGREVEDQLVPGPLLDRQIARLFPVENATDIEAAAALTDVQSCMSGIRLRAGGVAWPCAVRCSLAISSCGCQENPTDRARADAGSRGPAQAPARDTAKLMRSRPTGGVCPDASENGQISPLAAVRDARNDGNRPRCPAVLR